MTTVADLVEDTLNHLYGSYRPSFNVLATTVDADDTAITLTYATTNVPAGSYLSIGDELAFVLEYTAASKTATVIRGQRGSTAGAHTAGALVELNPRFPRFRIKKALRDEIRSWPASVFRVQSVDLATASGVAGYDLTGVTGFFNVLDVQLGPHPHSDGLDWTHVNFTVLRNADTSAFASGTGIILTGVAPDTARDLRVIVSRAFDVDTAWADDTDLDDVGLDASMTDIPPLGAAYRLLMGRDVPRSFGEGQGEPRNAEEIPPGFSGSLATFLKRQRDQRLADEAVRLLAKYPPRV